MASTHQGGLSAPYSDDVGGEKVRRSGLVDRERDWWTKEAWPTGWEPWPICCGGESPWGYLLKLDNAAMERLIESVDDRWLRLELRRIQKATDQFMTDPRERLPKPNRFQQWWRSRQAVREARTVLAERTR